MICVRYSDLGLEMFAADACPEDARRVPSPAEHVSRKGIAGMDCGGTITFTSADQSYPQLRALFADVTGWIDPTL